MWAWLGWIIKLLQLATPHTGMTTVIFLYVPTGCCHGPYCRSRWSWTTTGFMFHLGWQLVWYVMLDFAQALCSLWFPSEPLSVNVVMKYSTPSVCFYKTFHTACCVLFWTVSECLKRLIKMNRGSNKFECVHLPMQTPKGSSLPLSTTPSLLPKTLLYYETRE